MPNVVSAADASGVDQASIDKKNAEYWDELCGSALAKKLGIEDSSPASLARFDDWYLEYYPYLETFVPFRSMSGKKVLEVGLGYGTLSQKIAESGADFSGLDIAAGPVHMVNHRLTQSGLRGRAVQGSMLQCPFPENSFDYVIAIGCFHHTGNLQRSLEEARRVLKPGGRATVMVYYSYSYRRWVRQPDETFRHFASDKLGMKPLTKLTSESERAQYDKSIKDGRGAPETAFTSASEMKRLTRQWSSCKVHRRNIGKEWIFKTWDRNTACRLVGPIAGLDIYCHLVK